VFRVRDISRFPCCATHGRFACNCVILHYVITTRFNTLDERRNRCDLIEVFNGYTDIDIRVLFTLDGNDKGYMAIVRKFVNQNLTRILGNIFCQIESLTDKTVWTRTLLMHPI